MGPFQGFQPVLIPHRPAAPGDHRFPVAVGPQGHLDLGPGFLQNLRRQTAHLAVADDQHPLVFKALQFPLQNFPAPGAHGGDAPGQMHFRLGPLARGDGVAEQGRKTRVQGAAVLTALHGKAHLGDDLIFPQNLGVEAAGHFHQVQGRILPHPGGEKGGQFLLRSLGTPAQQLPGASLGGAADVKLRPVAGGEQHAALYPRLPGEPVQKRLRLIFRKGQGLPQGHPRPVAVQAGHH